MMKRLSILFMICLISSMSSAVILLDDTFADGTRTNTNLPTESAVWAGDSDIVVAPGSLQYGTPGYTDSHKLWTHFTPDGSPVSLGVGHKLTATIEFTPRGLYVNNSENFRMGLFNDPTDAQVHADVDDDGGGSGDPWQDSRGYGVRVTLSSGAGDNPQIGKRVDYNNTSLLGSSGAFVWDSGGADVEDLLDQTLHTAIMELDYVSASQLVATWTLLDATGGVVTSHSLIDDGTLLDVDTGLPTPISTEFDHLFFRFSAAAGTADVIDFHRITIDHVVPEPATMALLGLGGLIAIRRKR